MISPNALFEEAEVATYQQLLSRLDFEEAKPYRKCESRMAIDDLAEFIADKPYKGLHPFQDDMEIVERLMIEKYPGQELEISGIIAQLTQRLNHRA